MPAQAQKRLSRDQKEWEDLEAPKSAYPSESSNGWHDGSTPDI